MAKMNNIRMWLIRTLWLCLILQQITHSYGLDPKFDPSTAMRLVLVPADAAVGSVIYRLRATDEEFDYPLQFELVGDASSSTVQIDSLSCTKYNSVCQANVVLKSRLEPGRYYDFQVSVKDTKGGMAVQSCSITATNYTTVQDMIFPHKPAIITISEDAKRGTELDYVISRKNPQSPKPVYLELWGSPLFAIRQKIASPETTEGTIFLVGPLDFEKQAMYHLTILANDAYAEPGQDSRNIAGLEVIVIVEDVQDVPPIFTMAPPVTQLPAGLLPGDKILQVHAEDGDKGNPREIRYGLVSEGNPFTSFFDINDTSGEVYLLRSLEDIAAITHIGDPVLLTIIAEEVKVARDQPPAMATTVQLALLLPERSNSPPYFDNDHYVTRIDENAPQGTALIFNDPYVAGVYDDDTGKNGVFSLTLLGNNGTFEITPNVAERAATFLIRVRDNQLLDYESRHSVTFQILAQELGPATNLSAIVNVTIYLNDVNDNSPVFEQQTYLAEIPENITAGNKVIQVKATDVDSGAGGRIRYTGILGYLNTSLRLDAETGLISMATHVHGFDREQMSEYHFYVEARDMDGTGNSQQVPLIIKILDINDNAPVFDKSLYEFILTHDLKNFTSPAFIKAIDADAEPPNNIVRYEIINGNYENKFQLDMITGQLTLREPLKRRSPNDMQNINSMNDRETYVVTARAYDLGVPLLDTTTTIRIYPPENGLRTMTFIVPGHNLDHHKTEEVLSTLTGGRVIIQNIQPYHDTDSNKPNNNVDGSKTERSIITATVLTDGDTIIDVAQIERKFSSHNTTDITTSLLSRDESAETLYKAENRVLFWALIFLALLIAITILTLLLCCICSWCPLYAGSRKRVIRVNSTEDDVHLVHRELGVGKQTKSVQVAEWMGRREAWSAERPADLRTKPTHWQFSRRIANNQKLETDTEQETHVTNLDEKNIRNKFKDMDTSKDVQFHNSRTNLINDRDVYVEDVNDDEPDYVNQSKMHLNEERQIDDDSIRRHEVDRGSDIEYNDEKHAIKQRMAQEDENLTNRDQLFIKDGNAEILRLITRGKPQENENIYVNVPTQKETATAAPSQPQLIMVENGGKEILMRRFIEEQANGKQIIREHYRVIPPANNMYIHHVPMPNEVQSQHNLTEMFATKSGAPSIIYSNIDPAVGNTHAFKSDMQPANSSQSIHMELENSLKQQNALLRQILLEKERLEEKYQQQEGALETQSLPCQTMTAIATQTDCEAGTQTDPLSGKSSSRSRRRARSENDDSLSDDDYEYVRYSPPNNPSGVYWVKRKATKRRSKYKNESKGRRRVVVFDDIKRKIRTPIKEESEEHHSSSPPKKNKETRTSILRRMKNEANIKQLEKSQRKSNSLSQEDLHDISNSLERRARQPVKDKRKYLQKIHLNQAEYSDRSDYDSDDGIIIKRRNSYSADSLDDDEIEVIRHFRSNESLYDDDDYYDSPENLREYERSSTRERSRNHVTSVQIPGSERLARRDSMRSSTRSKSRRETTSEPPHSRGAKSVTSDPPNLYKTKIFITHDKTKSETDLLNKMINEAVDSNRPVPRYMEWYYKNKDHENPKKRQENVKYEKGGGSKPLPNKKAVGASEKRIQQKGKVGGPKQSDRDIDGKFKPEPMPRKSPPKAARMLKEDIQMSKIHEPHIQTDTNHPLLQHSEYRFERDYSPVPEIPVPPTTLPHYMYPETPPLVNREAKMKKAAKEKAAKPKPSPIREHVATESKLKSETLESQSRQLNAGTLEDDHDSGIAMNSLLHSMGKRNPIVDKKSVFTIAYDDAKVKNIQSESDSPNCA